MRFIKAFLSSTSDDLQDERGAVNSALARMKGVTLIGMEQFGSRNDNPQNVSLFEVDSCDIYIGIIAHRYGSGITHEEYKHARQKGMFCFVYIKSDSSPVPLSFVDQEEGKKKKLLIFKEELKRNHVVSPFSNPEELAVRVQADIHNLITADFSGVNLSTNKIATEVQHVQSARQSGDEIAIVLMDNQWLGLKVASQLHSEPNLTIVELETRLKVNVSLLAPLLARLTRSGVVDVQGSQFFCTDKGAEILSNLEGALATKSPEEAN